MSCFQIEWTAPSQPNGVLIHYKIYLYPLTEEGKNLNTAVTRIWQTETVSQTTYLIGALEPDQKYNIAIRAVNTNYVGNLSRPFPFVYKVQNKARVSDLTVVTDATSDNSVRLQWTKLSDGNNIEYKVSTKSDNLIAQYGDLVVNNVASGNVIEANVTGLSPDTSYVFGVAVVADGVAGPSERVLGRTTGKSLPRPTITDALVGPESGTSIKLTWRLPEDEKRLTGWTYGIYYGTNQVKCEQRKFYLTLAFDHAIAFAHPLAVGYHLC